MFTYSQIPGSRPPWWFGVSVEVVIVVVGIVDVDVDVPLHHVAMGEWKMIIGWVDVICGKRGKKEIGWLTSLF